MTPLSYEEYERMYKAFIACGGLVSTTARETGHTAQTVARYVERGDPARGMEPMRERAKREHYARMDSIDETYRNQVLPAHKQIMGHHMARHVKALTKVSGVMPHGEVQPDGTIVVDDVTEARMLRTSRELFGYQNDIRLSALGVLGAESQAVVQSVNVNVQQGSAEGGNMSPQELRDGLIAFVQKIPEVIDYDPNVRADARDVMVASFAAKEGARGRDAEEESLDQGQEEDLGGNDIRGT